MKVEIINNDLVFTGADGKSSTLTAFQIDAIRGLCRQKGKIVAIPDIIDIVTRHGLLDGWAGPILLERLCEVGASIIPQFKPSPIMRYFAHRHLPPALAAISAPIADLAERFDATLPDGAEKSAGLRKLLEAKDCFVRAALPPPSAYPFTEKDKPAP